MTPARLIAHGTVAGLALAALAVLPACSSSQPNDRDAAAMLSADEEREFSYLSSAALRNFDQQLRELADAVEDNRPDAAAAVRNSLTVQSLRYRAALVSGVNDRDSVSRRALSSAVLGFTGDGSFAIVLARKATDENERPAVRDFAALGLKELGPAINDSAERAQVMTLIRAMLLPNAGSETRRVHALGAYSRAFSRSHDDDPAVLISVLAEDPSPMVRREAVIELGQIGDPAFIEPITRLALNSDDEDLRANACVALGNIPDVRSLDALRSVLSSDSRPVVRMQAAAALGRLGEVNRDLVNEMVARAISDTQEIVRVAASQSAGQLRDERLIEVLKQSLADRSDSVRISAIRSLGRVIPRHREDEAYELVSFVEDSTADVASAAQDSLREITRENLGASEDKWRRYFYAKHRHLDPEHPYESRELPRPRVGGTGMTPRPAQGRQPARPQPRRR